MQPIYSLRHIVRRYGNRTVLDIENLTIQRGQSYALLGPNGAGKSTLLEVLALLNAPCEGDLDFDGEKVTWSQRALQQKQKKVTLVHQTPYLFNRSVFDNLAFGLALRGVSGAAQAKIIAAALDKVGLGGFDQRHAHRLSGGEAQRVALARALALKPEVLLLDEPTANVDRKVVPILEQVINELRESGTTLLIATHDREQASRLQCKTLWLEQGRVTSPVQAFQEPSNSARPVALGCRCAA